MKIVGITMVYNTERWVGYSIASWINHVDDVVVAVGPSTDHTDDVINSIGNHKISKLLVKKATEQPDGLSTIRTKLMHLAIRRGADWLFFPDSDMVFYPTIRNIRKVIEDHPKAGIIRCRQYFVYDNLYTTMDLGDKAEDGGFSSFIHLIKVTPDLKFTGRYHENLTGVQGLDQHDFRIQCVHTGTIASDKQAVQKFIREERIKHPERNHWADSQITKELIARDRIPTDLKDVYKYKRRARGFLPLDRGIPPVFFGYRNGYSDEDIAWLRTYIQKEKDNG